MDSTLERTPAVVVGGGLARLTTAAYLARNGQDVTLYEKSPTLGGRAATQEYDGFAFNRGRMCTQKRPHRGCSGRSLVGGYASSYAGLNRLSRGLYAARAKLLIDTNTGVSKEEKSVDGNRNRNCHSQR